MRKTLVVASLLSALSALSVSSVAYAQAAKAAPSYTVSGNVTVASDYIFRGYSQTNRKAALQGGFDLTHNSGLYAGLWSSSVSWLSDQNTPAAPISSSLEMDFYGGYRGSVGDISYDVGILQYYYPGSYPTGFTDPDTLELYGQVGWKWFTVKYSHATSDLFGVANTKDSNYLDLTGNFDLGQGVTLTGHVGHQHVSNVGSLSYTDWKVGVSKEFAGLNVGLAYTDTDASGRLAEDQVVFTVGKTF